MIATRAAVGDDGRYTGELEFYAYGEQKAVAIRELAVRDGLDLAGSYAYSDSITDLPMLDAVGHPVAVNPDKGLRREAEERGWETRGLPQPSVRLRSRIASAVPSARTSYLAGAVGVVAVASGARLGGAPVTGSVASPIDDVSERHVAPTHDVGCTVRRGCREASARGAEPTRESCRGGMPQDPGRGPGSRGTCGQAPDTCSLRLATEPSWTELAARLVSRHGQRAEAEQRSLWVGIATRPAESPPSHRCDQCLRLLRAVPGTFVPRLSSIRGTERLRGEGSVRIRRIGDRVVTGPGARDVAPSDPPDASWFIARRRRSSTSVSHVTVCRTGRSSEAICVCTHAGSIVSAPAFVGSGCASNSPNRSLSTIGGSLPVVRAQVLSFPRGLEPRPPGRGHRSGDRG